MLDLLIALNKSGCTIIPEGNSLRVTLNDKYLGHICNSSVVSDDTNVINITSLKQAMQALLGERNEPGTHSTEEVRIRGK